MLKSSSSGLYFFALATLLFSSSAEAQGVFGGFNPGYAMNMDVALSGSRGGADGTICGRTYADDNEKAELLRIEAQGQCSTAKSSVQSSTNDNRTLITFTPQKSRTRGNLQAFVDKARPVDPAGASQMEQLFATTDIIGEIGSVMANFGLSKNNAADAFALYWIAAWQAAHGDSSTPSSRMAQAVAAQAARGLSQSPEFAAATDAQKQEMAEALMVQAAMIEATVESAAGDRTRLKEIGKAVKQGAAASGLELDKMILTDEGFVEGSPRKGADASDAAPGDDARHASNDTNDGGMFILGRTTGRCG